MTNSLTVPTRARTFTAVTMDHRFRVFVGVIAVVAFVLRFAWTARGDGLHGIGGYDDGVYYASAASMVAGRMPYRDFLLLQPPLLQLVLVPFAAAARLVGDSNAFVAARIVFMAIGALNTVLIAMVLRRFGAGAVVTGTVFYALFAPAVHGERSALLEPLGTLGLLIAMVLLASASPKRPRLLAFLAGVALAAAVGAKLWYVLPAVLVLAAYWRRILFAAIGAVAGGLAIFLPFFVAAPANMWRQLVLDQLGRPADAGDHPDPPPDDPGRTGPHAVGAHPAALDEQRRARARRRVPRSGPRRAHGEGRAAVRRHVSWISSCC